MTETAAVYRPAPNDVTIDVRVTLPANRPFLDVAGALTALAQAVGGVWTYRCPGDPAPRGHFAVDPAPAAADERDSVLPPALAEPVAALFEAVERVLESCTFPAALDPAALTALEDAYDQLMDQLEASS